MVKKITVMDLGTLIEKQEVFVHIISGSFMLMLLNLPMPLLTSVLVLDFFSVAMC